MFRLITPSLYRSMPWKNGGGVTTEIRSHPEGAALETFAWRVSIADVGRDGPFSRFPGVDRTIVLLEGAGMRLATHGRNVELRTPFEPFAFAGDDAVECTLVSGAVRDFNVMCRRGHARGSVSVVRGDGALIPPAAFRIAYAAAGQHECVLPGHSPLTLGPGHALIVETDAKDSAAALAVRPLLAGGVALAVGIQCP